MEKIHMKFFLFTSLPCFTCLLFYENVFLCVLFLLKGRNDNGHFLSKESAYPLASKDCYFRSLTAIVQSFRDWLSISTDGRITISVCADDCCRDSFWAQYRIPLVLLSFYLPVLLASIQTDFSPLSWAICQIRGTGIRSEIRSIFCLRNCVID